MHKGVLFNHKEELNCIVYRKWMKMEDTILSEVSQT
jgi:hypothetical protein